MKEILRSALLNKRKAMSPDAVKQKSKKIQQELFALPIFSQTQMICFYVSFDNEVYTHDMIKEGFKLGKQIVVPRCLENDNMLSMHKISSWDDLSSGAHGILEPVASQHTKVAPETLEVIIVPGVGFDRKGHRIGHGFAYYDNFLPHSDAITIGLCFEQQIIEYLPVESHDIQMNIIITEDRCITCKKEER